MFKLDLHTHSIASPDGGLRERDYRAMLEGQLDCIAVTDHNTIAFAQKLHKTLGDKIIVGEEITAEEGEVIGLYLRKAVPPGLSVVETVAAIHKQGGLVYIPHPFETVRKGLPLVVLDEIAADVDIIEIHNGRAMFQNKSIEALQWAQAHHVAGAASSDVHGRRGWGRTYSVVEQEPNQANLTKVLGLARYSNGFVGPMGVLYPKVNRQLHHVRKRLGRA